MEKLEYPLVGYAAQFAEQDAIYERYHVQLHLCIIDPAKFVIETPEQMEKMVADFEPFIKEEEQEEQYQSGKDPEPNLVHIEIDDFESHYVTDALTSIQQITDKDQLGRIGAYPPKEDNSGGKLVVVLKIPDGDARVCFEFSKTGKSAPMSLEESNEFAVGVVRDYIK